MPLFEYAILYTPIQTKEQNELGEKPKTVLAVPVTPIVAANEKEAGTIAARNIPTQYEDKLSQVEVVVRLF